MSVPNTEDDSEHTVVPFSCHLSTCGDSNDCLRHGLVEGVDSSIADDVVGSDVLYGL